MAVRHRQLIQTTVALRRYMFCLPALRRPDTKTFTDETRKSRVVNGEGAEKANGHCDGGLMHHRSGHFHVEL